MTARGHTVTWLAKELHTARGNVYDIFQRKSIDSELLMRISTLLHYNFFDELQIETDNLISNSIKNHNTTT